mmetsp:Transcript_82592/g.233529  ORF Transcript_82592/g.233529 Transcript_82592/m.233529 type:complete len:97 (-) Transcript_82592:9-299(-)
MACCDERTISFHYCEVREQRAIHELLHNRDEWRSKFSDSRRSSGGGGSGGGDEALEQLWPGRKELGGYSHPLPARGDAVRGALVRLLLYKIRLCGE